MCYQDQIENVYRFVYLSVISYVFKYPSQIISCKYNFHNDNVAIFVVYQWVTMNNEGEEFYNLVKSLNIWPLIFHAYIFCKSSVRSV